jgi:hypothetical protein
MMTTDRMSAPVANEVQEAIERLIPVLEQFTEEELSIMYTRLSAVLERRAAVDPEPVHA